MKVYTRWFGDNGTEWGNGRQAFEREAIAALRDGALFLSYERDLTPGERRQVSPEAVLIETTAGHRAALRFVIEPERGEE